MTTPAPNSLPWMDRVRAEALIAAAARRILVFDGAMGTSLQDAELTIDDFGGVELEGCNENLVFTRPDAIDAVHAAFLEAGADIIETDTFGSTPLVLAEYGLEDRAHEQNVVATKIARAAAERFSTPDHPRFVAGSIGPTTKAITVTGGVTFDELIGHFGVQARGLLQGGADLLLVETSQDTRNVKAALIGIHGVFDELGVRVPVMVSCTIEPTGTMLAGQGVEAFWTSIGHFDLFAVGLNCATGPEFMTDHVRALADLATTRVSCIPNAGLPDEDGNYLLTPAQLATSVSRFVDQGWLNVVGGCCGTRPAHVRALAEAMRGREPRHPALHHRVLFSGIDFLESTDDNRPLIIGERTNVIGSRKFKRLIGAEKFEEAAEVGRAQVKKGAQMVDICLADPDREELEDTERLLDELIKRVKAPLVVDSTDAHVIERALTWCQGKALINSVNLEDGEERFESVVPIARRFGAALVIGCIDDDPDQGMGVTRQRKLEIAQRSYDILTQKYGIRPEDIVFDPLVFPCATGVEDYVGSAVETIEGVRIIKQAFPHCRTVLGISNVSFGLPHAGREVLNAVFLYHCTLAGLDMAIVNSEKLERYASIPPEERKLAEDLLWNRGDDPVAAFAAHFKGKQGLVVRDPIASLPLDERLARYIVEGTKEGLVPDLDAKLGDGVPPLEVINGPLMTGMDEVGRLFNANELIVAEVLQSAEAMKAAVSHLEQFMDREDASSKGKVLLATVKGDVHDIGKNLVDIILTNNGFEIVNLGIKVPPGKLVEAVREHTPDAIGLSGLLVKSAQMMVATAEDLHGAGIDLPILVGGAALSRNFTAKRIRPAYGDGLVLYAEDAMSGLALMERVMKPAERADLDELAARTDARRTRADTEVKAPPVAAVRSPSVSLDVAIPPVPDMDEHVVEFDPDRVWAWINPQMLYGRHMGLKGVKRKLLNRDPQAEKVVAAIEDAKAVARERGMRIRGVWRFFRAVGHGNRLSLLDGAGAELVHFDLPRQGKGDNLCIADYVLPPRADAEGALHYDHVGCFVTTAGEGIADLANEYKERGEYVRSHALSALAIESAEAAAEFLHADLRGRWGFPDPPETPMIERFQARYRGKRYSFGYPACPDLEMQDGLFGVLDANRIGVQLTDGHMMEPEASVSALVFHHPGATYFSA
jgi:5-methyltetrahydrofolate--homocysteine methyltransferase